MTNCEIIKYVFKKPCFYIDFEVKIDKKTSLRGAGAVLVRVRVRFAGAGAGAVLVRVKILRCGFVSAGAGAVKFFGAGNNINDL